MSRDWPSTLWPASFGGAPFWTERDNGEGGRRLAVSDLPGADVPLIEDLGNKTRPFEITGYTLGDASDVHMDALEGICNAQGPATLVLPAQGPQTVHCDHFRRERQKTQMGKFVCVMKFILVAPSVSAAPAEWLAQLTFDAVGTLKTAAAGFLGQVGV